MPKPIKMKTIRLTTGETTIVDDDDYDRLISLTNWNAITGYACHGTGKNMVFMHHLVLGRMDGKQVDHINHNTLDNRKTNLRVVTPSQNQFNRRKVKPNSASRFKGVSYHEGTGKWRARIFLNGKSKHLGLFRTQEEAAIAYNNAARKYYGEYALLNVV